MAKAKKIPIKKEIDSYDHKGAERVNIPQVGLVKSETDPDTGKKKSYQYDPHLDPQLQWTGKAERTSFEILTASLHIHERIDPRRIVDTVRKQEDTPQLSLFEAEKKPLREAIEFYKHKENWSNRLIAGDSLVIMNSLLEKEAMAGKVQMVYFDPPYGIKYGSNFQPFVNKRDVADGKDDDLSSEPEMLKAFRDTWELGIHSYLSYVRDRLILARELLSESGSVFVQINDKNLHYISQIVDEVFGSENKACVITFTKAQGPTQSNTIPVISDYLVQYAKSIKHLKHHHLYKKKVLGDPGTVEFRNVELEDGSIRRITDEEYNNPSILPKGAKIFATTPIVSQGYSANNSLDIELQHDGKPFTLKCGNTRHWSVGVEGTKKLWNMGRLMRKEGLRIFKSYLEDFPYSIITNVWSDMRGETDMTYVVQTNRKVLERVICMSTEPGDLVLDITCGSGTTALIAEQFGRRWITCDTSRISLALAKQRLLTATFPFYKLYSEKEGISNGLIYESYKRHVKSTLANNLPPIVEVFYDQPLLDSKKIRVTGPFTMEAVPAPTVLSLGESIVNQEIQADFSISRTGGTRRQDEWRSELLRTGVRGKGGAKIEFSRVEPIQGTTYLQAEAEVKDTAKKVLVCFGPEHAPLEQRLVELALGEAGNIKPKPDMVLFCAFQFDEEASKDIDETNWPGVNLLKAQMNMDLQTDDLKKGNRSSESFWLIGQPDVEPIKLKDGNIQISVNGFDYYDPKSGQVVSGGKDKIAMWLLDHNYDGRSLFPSQVFLPLSGAKEGWSTLAKNLKAEIDEDRIEAYSGTVSLPFKPGKQVAVKIIDDRGIESLKIIKL